MNKEYLLGFDTETTGLPNWSVPSDDESQPHLVELGAILFDKATGEEQMSLSVIIKPDGWVIPDETIEVHGITNELAHQVGIPEKDAIELLLQMRGDFERVAHNKTFDQRIIRIGLKRYFDEATQEKWAVKDDFHCSMMMAKPIMKMPKANAKPDSKAFKPPKLEEAYRHFMGKEMTGAHRAIHDARACKDIFVAMQR